MASRGGLREFLDTLAAPTATPGGGSAAAAAAAMAAALGAMVARLAKLDAAEFEQMRAFFTEAVDRDAAAFREVMAAYRRPKEERGPYVQQALRLAAEVPLGVFIKAAGARARRAMRRPGANCQTSRGRSTVRRARRPGSAARTAPRESVAAAPTALPAARAGA